MSTWRDLVSPWAIAGLALWLAVMVVVTQFAIPIFANVASPGVQCLPTACPTRTTTEWLPSLAVAAIVASLVLGAIWGAFALIRHRG